MLRARGGVAGHDIVDDAQGARLRIGAALQDISLDPRQTGRELLRLQGRLCGLKPAVVDERMRELTSLVGIGDALDRRIETYSGGMRRRLDLAAALVHKPEVLFLDEPTTGLDPASRARVWDEVRMLSERLGMTILLTTQYLEEADALAGRIGIINDVCFAALRGRVSQNSSSPWFEAPEPGARNLASSSRPGDVSGATQRHALSLCDRPGDRFLRPPPWARTLESMRRTRSPPSWTHDRDVQPGTRATPPS